MTNAYILDCTLRDGGYINNFSFGAAAITNIIQKLGEAKIDIIECGFLKSGHTDSDQSLFPNIASISKHLSNKRKDSLYVAMIAYGDISIEEISVRTADSIDGIRLTFHEHEIQPALILGRQLMDKGYLVFMQPVGTTTYNDKNLLSLIEEINNLKPFAFYLVDTLGVLYKNDLLRLFYLIDHNLSENICLGFHSHNNLQLSFANAQELLLLHSKRTIILDSSVFGMGRGVGNLCTELITQYINDNIENKYQVLPILEIMDNYITPLCNQYKWGYAVPYFLSSSSQCHPNYAAHLLNKETISIRDIFSILHHIPLEKRTLYDKQYIEKAYQEYLEHTINDSETLKLLKEQLMGKKVLLIAPGYSIKEHEKDIQQFISAEMPVTISINFIPDCFKLDYVFVSNRRRFKQLEKSSINCKGNIQMILTSNIPFSVEHCLRVNYASYLNENETVSDNSGLMLLTLLQKLDVSEVYLAGFDGFSNKTVSKYYTEQIQPSFDLEEAQRKTQAIKEQLKKLQSFININFLTPSQYNKCND